MGEASPIWNAVDVAKYFGLSTYSLRLLCNGKRQGKRSHELDFSKLPRFRVGAQWRWFASDVREFARKAVANG